MFILTEFWYFKFQIPVRENEALCAGIPMLQSQKCQNTTVCFNLLIHRQCFGTSHANREVLVNLFTQYKERICTSIKLNTYDGVCKVHAAQGGFIAQASAHP